MNSYKDVMHNFVHDSTLVLSSCAPKICHKMGEGAFLGNGEMCGGYYVWRGDVLKKEPVLLYCLRPGPNQSNQHNCRGVSRRPKFLSRA